MTLSTLRHPAVAGRFYPNDREELHAEAQHYLSAGKQEAPVRAIGCIAPHAGYMFSGHVAGAVFASVEVPRKCIVMCPNHTGQGQAISILSEGAWETPLGDIPVDADLAGALKQRCDLLCEDAAAHRAEHAAEVELPFLLLRQPELMFVPIALGTGQLDLLERLGLALADVIGNEKDPVLIVASSDMNHYESDAITRAKDHRAIERILSLDPRGLHDVVTNQNVSMCGYGPAVAMLTAARQLGAKSAELVKYATSADVSGDREHVVGYAGVVVH